MKSLVAVRHIHFEDLGTLEPMLREKGYDIRYVDATVDRLDARELQAADLLVVLGGPIGAFEEGAYPFLANELEMIRQRLAADTPILGVCLGAQLIARVLGAEVYPMGVKEIGFAPLDLTPEGRSSPLAALGDTPVLHWHGDQFDIPASAVRLASTPICPNQAFAVGSHVLGLQFHLEATPGLLERWLVGHASELAQAGIDPRTLRAQARQAEASGRLAAAARSVMGAWLDGIESAAVVSAHEPQGSTSRS